MNKTIRKWEYKGVMLEVKHIRLMDESQIEMATIAGMGDFSSLLTQGHHCGYATIAKSIGNGELEKHLHDDYGHPDIDVHGGVTFYQVNSDDTVTYGFDCAHFMDTIEVWDTETVSIECQNLANQLRKIAGIVD